MSVLYAILLGIIQGITEFLPVSSFGHISIIQNMLKIQRGPGILFETMLHMGTLAAVFMAFHKDVVHVFAELVGMLMDIIGNANLYIRNKRTGKHLNYARIINSSYRKFAVLLLVSMIPTAAIGYTARRLVVKSAVTPLMSGIGLLITGIILLVVDFSKSGGTRASRDANYSHAMWIGICQGLSVFPGISRSGVTISAALLCGFSRAFAVKYSYLLSVPAIVGSMFLEIEEFTSPGMSIGQGFSFVLGMIVAGIVGYFTIRFLLKLVHKRKLRYFAYYCFLAGALTLTLNYLA